MNKEFELVRGDYIKLGQLLKVMDVVSSGVDAKIIIQEGMVLVNGEIDLRRGRKIVRGDIIQYKEERIIVK